MDDYKKRDYLLPEGCKDLVDVLRLPTSESADFFHAFAQEILTKATNATEILITAPILGDGESFIMQRINGTFYPVGTVHAHFRSSILARFLTMANLPEATFPAHGVVTLRLKQRQLKWNLQFESETAECRLTPCDA
jgi:hypothetical protein